MYEHILVPTDGSDVSQRGVNHGFALAKALGARVTIMVVTDPFPTYSGITPASLSVGKDIMDAFDDQQARIAEGILKKAKDEADRLGVAASTLHVPRSHPADAIVDAATSRGADLIVMASHGRRGFGRLLLGSQASGVVNHSPVPVLVVR